MFIAALRFGSATLVPPSALKSWLHRLRFAQPLHRLGFSRNSAESITGCSTFARFAKLLPLRDLVIFGDMPSMIGLPSDHALVEDDECLRKK
ncbi:putative L-ascorbate peroxidase 6 isoform X3 [Cicer arietinum]|uniref:putative L-ascorbate peroxidase 6 isoform X3 n=1 Tax=Cicer arietinum TaxID=3827 RepID=UPI003CC5EDA8